MAVVLLAAASPKQRRLTLQSGAVASPRFLLRLPQFPPLPLARYPWTPPRMSLNYLSHERCSTRCCLVSPWCSPHAHRDCLLRELCSRRCCRPHPCVPNTFLPSFLTFSPNTRYTCVPFTITKLTSPTSTARFQRSHPAAPLALVCFVVVFLVRNLYFSPARVICWNCALRKSGPRG
jgi:hypothetical protein